MGARPYCRAELNYLGESGIEPGAVEVLDARMADTTFSWREQGFELVQLPCDVTNWSDEQQLTEKFLPEIEALAKRETQCDFVLFYPPIIRSRERAAASADLAPVQLAHSDYTEAYRAMLNEEQHPYQAIIGPSMRRAGVTLEDVRSARRLVTLQIWRNTGSADMDYPLALCDANTVARDALMPLLVEEYGGVRTQFESFALLPPQPDESRAWYTFPRLAGDEVLLFRAYDSEAADSGRPFWTPHTAFRDPVVGENASPRESVEVRALCFSR